MQNNTVFVLLAGGKSERMGLAKGLLKYQETFWILEQLKRISKTNISEVFIGLGHNYQHYFEAIPWFEKALTKGFYFEDLKVKIDINKNPELGSFSTLQTVLKTIDISKNIVLNPIDVPLLKTSELKKIISEENEIVIPNYKGKNGHPIKMKASFWNNLTCLDLNNKDTRLDFQLKKISPDKISRIEVFDKAILYNLNKKSDWNSYLKEVL